MPSYDIGELQVVEKEIEAEKTTTEVVQQELPGIKEVIELDDDEEPLVSRANPVSAQDAQGVEMVAKAGEDPVVIQQAASKKSSPIVKYVCLAGKPSIKIKRSTK